MTELPSFAALRDVPRERILGLLREHGDPVRAAAHDHEWQRTRESWRAVGRALAEAVVEAPADVGPTSTPTWLSQIVAGDLRRLSTSDSGWGGFTGIRLVERLGLVAPEHDDTYVLAFVSGYGERNATGYADLLREDRDLMDDVLWRCFEVEGGGEVSLANVDRWRGDQWRRTVQELVATGDLTRERVLGACLAALTRDFAAYRAAWFLGTYLALEPTDEEKAAHQPQHRAMLRSTVPATVTAAVRLLTEVGVDRLDRDATLVALGPAVEARTKSTALAALKLAVALAPDGGRSAIAVVRLGLGHPHADVQRFAARQLGAWDAQATVVADADLIAPSLREELGLAPTPGPAPQAPARDHTAPNRSAPADVREQLAALLEDSADADTLERVLAALAALDDPTLLTPLTRRAQTVLRRGPRDDEVDGWLAGQVARLVLVAAGERPDELASVPGTAGFLVRRFDEVAAVLDRSRPPHILLATPDDGGWVSPDALVARVTAADAIDRHDLVAALLRLGPDGREEVLDRATTLPGSVGAVVRHALGAPPPEPRRGGGHRPSDAAWWVAASRARSPLAEDPHLLHLGLGGAGQGRPLDVHLAATARRHTWQDASGTHGYVHQQYDVSVTGAVTDTAGDQPTTLLAAPAGHLGSWVPVLAGLWPHDAEHFLVPIADRVLPGMVATEVDHDRTRVIDAVAAHPGRLGVLAHAVLATGLSAGRPDARVHAVDAFADLVVTGRIPTQDLARAMATVAPACTPTRWASSLTEATRAPGGAPAVIGVLTALLPCLPADTRGLHALLEALHETSLRTGITPRDECLRAWLATVGGSGKAARTARRLLG